MAESSSVTLQLTDPEGHPLAGALVGLHLGCHLHTGMKTWLSSHEKRDRGPAKSDEQGRVTLEMQDLFPPQDPDAKSAAVYALHAYRRMAGLVLLTRQHAGKEVVFPLKRACLLHGQVESTELRDLGRAEHWWSNVVVDWQGHRPLSYATCHKTFEFFVPPGKYRLRAYGRDTTSEDRAIKIVPEQRDAEVKFDLAVTDVAKSFNMMAPELEPVKCWRFGGPVKLSDLRGEVVLLSFWGAEDADQGRTLIPTLMQLHEMYQSHGLKIIAIHDASIKNESRFDEKLAILRANHWENKEPTFPIALDAGGYKKGRGLFDWRYTGRNMRAFGVSQAPKTLLIDQDGRIVREIHPQVPLMQFELGRLLGVEGMLAVEPA